MMLHAAFVAGLLRNGADRGRRSRWSKDRVRMLITPYLDGFNVDPETEQVLGVALEMTRVSLGLADDFANGIIAKQVIELAKAGERNPTCLRDGAIEKLREHLYGD
jgi:hypothetical protein